MHRRQAIIALLGATGVTMADGIDRNFAIPDNEPSKLVFNRNAFKSIIIESEDGDIEIPWADVIAALR